MRAFLAFDLDGTTVDSASALADRLRERTIGGVVRWCKKETMHVTARFFGDGVELPMVTGIAALLVGDRSAPRVRMTRLDAFPDARKARVLVLAIDASELSERGVTSDASERIARPVTSDDDGSLAAIASEVQRIGRAVTSDDDGSLAAIASEAERIAVERGFAPEKRAYRPHLTLARFRQPTDVRTLIAETAVDLEGRAEALALYESKLGPNGPAYAALERVTFAR